MLSLIDTCVLFVVLLQAWVTISNKSPVMVLQEHLSLQMLAATVIMALMPTKQPMDQQPMEEVERILEEGQPMFLVDSIHTDARQLWRRFIQKMYLLRVTKFQNVHFPSFPGEIIFCDIASFNLLEFVIFCFSRNSRRRGKLLYASLPS